MLVYLEKQVGLGLEGRIERIHSMDSGVRIALSRSIALSSLKTDHVQAPKLIFQGL